MESFGEKLVSLAEPLWELQIKAMERMFLWTHVLFIFILFPY
jgi:hypothetical protein